MQKFFSWIDRRFAIAGTVAITALAATAVFQNSAEAQSKRMMDVTFANITNDPIEVTAKDLNDGGKTIATKELLKHNEQFTRKVVVDKDNNGHVIYVANVVNGKKCKKYEGKQLSNGFTFSISADQERCGSI